MLFQARLYNKTSQLNPRNFGFVQHLKRDPFIFILIHVVLLRIFASFKFPPRASFQLRMRSRKFVFNSKTVHAFDIYYRCSSRFYGSSFRRSISTHPTVVLESPQGEVLTTLRTPFGPTSTRKVQTNKSAEWKVRIVAILRAHRRFRGFFVIFTVFWAFFRGCRLERARYCEAFLRTSAQRNNQYALSVGGFVRRMKFGWKRWVRECFEWVRNSIRFVIIVRNNSLRSEFTFYLENNPARFSYAKASLLVIFSAIIFDKCTFYGREEKKIRFCYNLKASLTQPLNDAQHC